MVIHAYIQSWNEIVLMPYVLRHYGSFCDKIIVNDDGSDDGTRELVQACPIAELRDLGANGVNEIIFLQHWHNDYKESRGIADWVILADADEFIYHPNIKEILSQYQQQGINFPKIQGYNLFSNNLPTTNKQIYDEIYYGHPAPQMCKYSVFDPNLDVSFSAGRHEGRATNAISNKGTSNIALLHYVVMGFDYYNKRQLNYQPRMSKENIANGWGSYIFSSEEGRKGSFISGHTNSAPIWEWNVCTGVEALQKQ